MSRPLGSAGLRFCDHYAHKRTRVNVAQGEAEAETILLDGRPPAAKAPAKAAPPILSRGSMLSKGSEAGALEIRLKRLEDKGL